MPADGRHRHRKHAPDRGSATVWVLLLTALVVLSGTWALALGQAVTARHRAGAAADLSALTAADHALEGQSTACAHASSVARAQQARLVACAVRGDIADVLVAVPLSGLLEPVPDPTQRARAGPISDEP